MPARDIGTDMQDVQCLAPVSSNSRGLPFRVITFRSHPLSQSNFQQGTWHRRAQYQITSPSAFYIDALVRFRFRVCLNEIKRVRGSRHGSCRLEGIRAAGLARSQYKLFWERVESSAVAHSQYTLYWERAEAVEYAISQYNVYWERANLRAVTISQYMLVLGTPSQYNCTGKRAGRTESQASQYICTGNAASATHSESSLLQKPRVFHFRHGVEL